MINLRLINWCYAEVINHGLFDKLIMLNQC